MRAGIFRETGDPEVVEMARIDDPEPGFDEVRTAVGAASVNHLDSGIRGGLPVDTPIPHVGGSEVAGMVAAPGADPWT